MNIRPIGDRILVEPIVEQVTKSGLIIPDSVRKNSSRSGIVRALGTKEGLSDILSIGNEVIYNEHAGDRLEKDGKIYMVIPTSSIIVSIN